MPGLGIRFLCKKREFFHAKQLGEGKCSIIEFTFLRAQFGPEISKRDDLAARAHFHAYGLAGTDAYGPLDNPKMYTLPTLMGMNGHTFIDVLKVE